MDRARRAADLLRGNLTEDQWQAAREGQHIRVTGQYSKATYLISETGIVWVAFEKAGHRVVRLCVSLGGYPLDDNRLAFALYAAHDERRLLKTAGFYPECYCKSCTRVLMKLKAIGAAGPIGLRLYRYPFW